MSHGLPVKGEHIITVRFLRSALKGRPVVQSMFFLLQMLLSYWLSKDLFATIGAIPAKLPDSVQGMRVVGLGLTFEEAVFGILDHHIRNC